MEQEEFLTKHVFNGLKALNNKLAEDVDTYFSETDFEIILERVQHFGIGIYVIDSQLKGKPFEVVKHEQHKKKATDPKWYNKAFLTAKTRQPGLTYGATFKVSNKLLTKDISTEE